VTGQAAVPATVAPTSGGTKFVVLTAPRTGSTWFVDTLNSLPDTAVCTELLLPRKKPRDQRLMSWRTAEYLDRNLRSHPLFVETTGGRVTLRPFSVVGYLNGLFRRPGAVGFKLMYANLLRYPEAWAYVVLRRLHVIHLVRRNHLDVAISEQMRQTTGTVHRIADEPEAGQRRIDVDPAELLRLMRRSQRNVRIARLLLHVSNVPRLEVAYERLVDDSREFERVCEFLSINRERRAGHSKLVKLVRGRAADILSNYDEVKRTLRATEFSSLLD
jgi:LPS sulfotransferase NodH